MLLKINFLFIELLYKINSSNCAVELLFSTAAPFICLFVKYTFIWWIIHVMFVSYYSTFRSVFLNSPVEPCLSFSFFFFLHFQGLKMRPRLASLLLRRMGGVRTPDTRQPEWSVLCGSITSAAQNTSRNLSEEFPSGANVDPSLSL